MFPSAKPKQLFRKEKEWLTDAGHNSWWHLKRDQHAVHNLKFEKMGLFRHPRTALKRLKNTPTWLRATPFCYNTVYYVCKWLGTMWSKGRIFFTLHSSSSLFRPIWTHLTYKMLICYILSSVCLRSSPFSQLSSVLSVAWSFSAYRCFF